MKRILAAMMSTMMVLSMMAGCSQGQATTTTPTTPAAPSTETKTETPVSTNTETPAADKKIEAPASDVEMQYITVDDAEKVLNDENYVFFDVRKAVDAAMATIPNALSYDMDAAKGGDFEAGVKVMQEATKDLDKNVVIICYSGKTYAQATTNVLSALGYDMSKVYTLKGGFTAWNKAGKEVKIADEVKAPEADVAMQYISVADAAKLLTDENYVFFDVRTAENFEKSAIPGAVSHNMDAAKNGDFAHGVATMQLAIRNLDKNIIIICNSGKSYAQAATNVLSAIGYDMSKVYTLEGGMKAWEEFAKTEVAMQYISVADALNVLEDDSYVFFDVRKAENYSAGHIKGALGYDMDAAKNGDFNAGLATMIEATKGLDKNIVIICNSGKSYAQATTNVLSALGYDMSKVFTLEGGMKAWTEGGHAVEA